MDVNVYEAVEKPLPKPSAEDYASARLLEALVESLLALRFLEEGLVRNAAGKAFQAWRAVLATLLRLELDKLKALAKDEEERRWLEERAVPRVPTTRMVPLSQRLSELGYLDISACGLSRRSVSTTTSTTDPTQTWLSRSIGLGERPPLR